MSDLQSTLQIFQNKLFRIPDYQRGFAWKESQLLDFWDDLVNLQDNHYHYTGMLSLKLIENYDENDDLWLLKNGYNAYHIIDGQQRLTTFVILINEIINVVKELPENADKKETDILLGIENLNEIRAKYIYKSYPPENIITTYIFSYENDNPSAEYLKYKIFNDNLSLSLKETYYTKNLQFAKIFFHEKLNDLISKAQNKQIVLSKLYQKLTQSVVFNIHEIKRDYDVFVAFETMNNRGKPLSNLELLKNRLIYLTTIYKESELPQDKQNALRKNINDAWKEIYFQLGRNEKLPLSDDEFLRAHWTFYFSYSRKKGNNYKTFLLRKFSQKSIYMSPFITDEDLYTTDEENESLDDYKYSDETDETNIEKRLQPAEINDYVKSLQEAAPAWYYSFYPDDYQPLSSEERIWIGKLNKIGINYFRPLVTVSLMPSMKFSPQNRLKLYKAIERFIFVNFRIGGSNANWKNSEYYNKTRDLFKGIITIDDYINDLEEQTNENIQSCINLFLIKMDQNFENAEGFYSWNPLKYFLYEYEYTLFQKYKIDKLDWAVLTNVVKDKISIEHILPQTSTEYYWSNLYRQYSDDEIKYFTNSLGNLLPLSSSINSSLQNDSFEKKKQRGYYNGSHSEIEVSQITDWDAQEIYKRSMHLLDFMEKRWNISFESVDQKEKLLHLVFIHEKRDELPPLSKEEFEERTDNNLSQLRKQYWKYALPIIRASNIDNGAYANVEPNDSSYKDGYFGIGGVHFTCVINMHPIRCSVCIWIDTGYKNLNDSIFNLFYSHKDEIESKMSTKQLEWNKKEGNRSRTINAILDNIDFRDSDNWEKMASFQAKLSKELYDNIIKAYESEIKQIL